MRIHKIPSLVDYNFWMKHLDTQPNKSTNQNSFKVLKVVKPTNKKTLLKTLGTSVINIPIFLSLLITFLNKKNAINNKNFAKLNKETKSKNTLEFL